MVVSGLLLVKTKSLSQIQTNCFAALLWRYCFICFTVAVVIRQPPQWCEGVWQLWGGQQPPWAKEICTQLWNPTYERQICKYVELKPFCFGQPLKKKKSNTFLRKASFLKINRSVFWHGKFSVTMSLLPRGCPQQCPSEIHLSRSSITYIYTAALLLYWDCKMLRDAAEQWCNRTML